MVSERRGTLDDSTSREPLRGDEWGDTAGDECGELEGVLLIDPVDERGE